MHHCTYIIYSELIDKYYTGSTSQPLETRIYQHNLLHKGFTGKANDWKVVFSEKHNTIQEARLLEKRIKKNGAKRFLKRFNS